MAVVQCFLHNTCLLYTSGNSWQRSTQCAFCFRVRFLSANVQKYCLFLNQNAWGLFILFGVSETLTSAMSWMSPCWTEQGNVVSIFVYIFRNCGKTTSFFCQRIWKMHGEVNERWHGIAFQQFVITVGSELILVFSKMFATKWSMFWSNNIFLFVAIIHFFRSSWSCGNLEKIMLL